jgi:CheY-like chemotaxis protein/HPt (histidine-containing phosphotransfer) domain-containing protein
MQALGKSSEQTAGRRWRREQESVLPENIQGARVLLVEDNDINQQVAREILEGAGLNVTVATNGQQAVDAVKAGSYDAVLMDVQMPVMDGYTATRKIREWEAEVRGQKAEDREQRIEDEEKVPGVRSQVSADREPRSPVLKPAAAGLLAKTGPPSSGLSPSSIQNPESNIQHPESGIQDQIPILAMTAHAMSGDEEKSLAAGMNGHVTKPIDPDKLFAALQKWIKPDKNRIQVKTPEPVIEHSAEDEARQEEDGLPENLPGFDLADGLKRLRGNKTLYRKLLLSFAADYRGAAGQIRAALDAKDFERAHGLVHNLKGLAGNLGAAELQSSAVNLEKLVKGVKKENPAAADLNLKFAVLEKTLNQALASVQGLGASAAENVCTLPDDLIAAVPSELAHDIAKRIRDAAEFGDVRRLNAIAAEIETLSDTCVPISRQIAELAEEFDLEGIQKLADALDGC